MYQHKIRFVILGIVAAAGFAFSGCNNATAGQVRTDVESWLKNLLTPRQSTLEEVNAGYSIKGSIKNKPKNLVMLFEVTPGGLVILDSARTNDNGDFVLDGNVKEPLICQLQWGENSMVYMVVDNKTQAKIELAGTGLDVTYTLAGKGIDASTEMKQLIDLNIKYLLQLKTIEDQAGSLPPTEDGYKTGQALQARYYTLLAERNQAIKTLALSYKASPVPYFVVFSGMLEEIDFALLEHAYTSVKAFSESSKYTAEMQKRYEVEKQLAIGAVAPEINLKQPDGTTKALSSLRGKVVLVDFWASWCGPCRRENPFNRTLYRRFKDKGFEIFGVSLDEDANRWKNAIAADSLTWYHVSDLGGWKSAPAKQYRVSSIPATYLLDKEGRIIAKGLRGEQLQAKLEEILGR